MEQEFKSINDVDVASLMKGEGIDTEKGNTFDVKTGELQVITVQDKRADVRDGMFVVEIVDNNGNMCSKIIIWIVAEKDRKKAVEYYNNKEEEEKRLRQKQKKQPQNWQKRKQQQKRQHWPSKYN